MRWERVLTLLLGAVIDALPTDDPTDLWFQWSPSRLATAIIQAAKEAERT